MGILEKLIYKKDVKNPGSLRISKAKVISWVLFVVMFVLSRATTSDTLLLKPSDIVILNLIFAAFVAIVAYIIGYIIGHFLDKRNA